MTSTKTTSRLVRWALKLQKFDFIIEYRKGKLNAVPDALSRMTNLPACNMFTSQKNEVDLPITAADLWEEQHKDLEIVVKSVQLTSMTIKNLQANYNLLQPPGQNNEILGVDIMGPFPSSSPHHNEYLLVCVDYFIRWVEMFPMRNATTAHPVCG